jgi:hypothetical protein
MSLRLEAQQALAGLPNGAAAQTLSARDGDLELECALEALDTLACTFARLSVRSPALAGAGERRLRQVAEDISRRVTYLLEPVAPIEVDAEQSIVQLRSVPPQRQEGTSTYYELLVRRGGEVCLQRFAKPPGQPRAVVPAHVTREVLLRLIDDFAAVL